jgi:putative ABC transport system permease protein
VSYSVARRTREMGIRMALGARPGDVRWAVVRGAMGMVGLGLALGLLGAVAVTRTLQSLLYEVSPMDPVALVAAVAVLGGAGFLASWLQARGGGRVDPMVSMRAD